jgi:1,4-alpha-glucan branching enzyme
MTRWNLLLCASLIMSALAQDRIVPHDVSADRHVTFRLNAPKANQVMLNFAAWNTKPQPMTKNEKGVWSIPASFGP